MQNILLVGATGNLGPYVAKELVIHGKNVFALIRPESFSNPKKIGPLKELGVNLVKGDLSDLVSLEKACKGMDAVISTVGGGQILQQEALIKAAKAAGVKRFIPSEFGMDPHACGPGVCDFFDAKAAVQKKIKSAGLPYTMIYTNGFMEFWAAGLGQIGNSVASGEVAYFGNGNVYSSMVSMADVARFTVAVLDDPEMVNREVRITANVMTQEELIRTWERLSGRKVKRNPVTLGDLNQMINRSTTPETAGLRIVAQLHRSAWIYGDELKIRPETLEATREYPDLPIKNLEVFFHQMLTVAV